MTDTPESIRAMCSGLRWAVMVWPEFYGDAAALAREIRGAGRACRAAFIMHGPVPAAP